MAIEDYFKGSSQAYGQVAGSLLAGRRKKDKKEAKRALIASTVMATFGALQNQQKQTIIDNSNDVKEKYGEIFNLNKSEFEAFGSEREQLKEYNKNKETFLNSEVAKVIDNTDEAVTARVKWADVDKQPDETLRKSMYAAYNSERKKLKNRMEALNVDPRATTKSFEQFNQKATDEYKAALALVEDDPTKKGLIKAAWNRIFKTERKDGELVTTNSDLLDLQKNLKDAKEGRTTFRDSIENQVIEEQLYKPLVFTAKPKDLSEIYTTVIPNLTKLVSNQDKFNNVEPLFFKEVIDNILKEEPNLTLQQVNSKAYTSLLNKEIDPKDYLNREGAKIANGIGLITAFEKLDGTEQDNFINNKPEKLGQLVDAYKREDRLTDGNLLLTKYKNVYETNKEFTPNSLQIQSNVDRIRSKLNPRVNKELLVDTTALGILGNNVSYTENYYKKNNPNWDKTFTEVELKDLAVKFTMDNYENKNSTNVRMTNADLLVYKMGSQGEKLTEEILDEIPNMVEELKTVGREKEIVDLRNVLNKAVEINQSLEYSEDQKEEFKQKINVNFKDFDLVPYEKNVVVDEGRRPTTETISQTVTGSSIKEPLIEKPIDYDVMDELAVKGLLDYHKGSKTLFLKNFDETVDSFDFSTTPKEELKYLYLASPNNIKKDLSVDYDTRLTFKGKENNSLQDKIFTTIKTRFIEEGFSNKEADKKTKDELSANTGNFRIPSNEFFETFKSSLLAPSLNPSKSYLYYQKRFNKDY